MGAGQSSTAGGQRSSAGTEVKESYYDLLGVDRQATDEELKKAYRRKALELHPDRNYGDAERATALFAAVQAAYEVLSDPQERAWYDSHEAAILRDMDPTATADTDDPAARERDIGLTSAADIAALLRHFHPGIPFTDAPDGFHGFLRRQFDTLAAEEAIAARRANVPERPYPPFGTSSSPPATAKLFYATWSSFSTSKSFAWRDRYRAHSTDDRRTRRALDRENARLRRDAAAEFSDAVRALVAFARRRDPRVAAVSSAGSAAGSERERADVLRGKTAAQGARMRARHNAAAAAAAACVSETLGAEAGGEGGDAVPLWARARPSHEGAAGMDAHEATLESGSSSSEEEQFECVACRKVFKSERQWEAHERSKKHAKAIEALRRKMEKEGVRFGVDEGAHGEEEESGGSEIDGDGVDSTIDGAPASCSHSDDASNAHVDDDQDDDESAQKQEDDLSARTAALSTADPEPSTTSAKPSPTLTPSSAPLADSAATFDPEPDTDTGGTDTDEDAPSKPTPDPDSDTDDAAATSLPATQKKGKAAQKRAKRAAAAAAATAAATDEGGARATCATCGAGFASRSQLFQHIKDHGHAAPAGKAGNAAGGKKKKGKR